MAFQLARSRRRKREEIDISLRLTSAFTLPVAAENDGEDVPRWQTSGATLWPYRSRAIKIIQNILDRRRRRRRFRKPRASCTCRIYSKLCACLGSVLSFGSRRMLSIKFLEIAPSSRTSIRSSGPASQGRSPGRLCSLASRLTG